MNKCNWTENFINKETGKLEIKECQNTNTIKDEGNVKDRWFCIDKDNHIEEVIKTRKIMHKNCINKEKLIKYLSNEIAAKGIRSSQIIALWLKEEIENGGFDNE